MNNMPRQSQGKATLPLVGVADAPRALLAHVLAIYLSLSLSISISIDAVCILIICILILCRGKPTLPLIL